ncbi:MAG: glycosyltransferase [Prochloraceae cyanobacterium]|nr:glycosyltransferase [Prochloraceae cyanobacterium]
MSNNPEGKSDFLPKVSVIVPIYNGEKDLPDLIECLRSQNYPATQVEYLLVDNNSSDRTSEILEAAVKKNSPEQPTIHNLREDNIQSSYAARNLGIKAAQNNILCFTDADCRPDPDWLKQLVQPFTNPDVAIVAGKIASVPGETLLEKYADKYEVLSEKYAIEHPFCPYGQTANLAIRKQALEKVGLFRPYLTTGGDADICWRILRETNWQIELATEAIIRHRHRSTLSGFLSQWRRYGNSNRYLHELHGVDLAPKMTTKYMIYRLSRWLLKELPINSIKAIVGKETAIELFKTPIELLGSQARSAGQKESKLSELAKEIERL